MININVDAYPLYSDNTGNPSIKLPTIPFMIPATACQPLIFSYDSSSMNNNRFNIFDQSTTIIYKIIIRNETIVEHTTVGIAYT